MKTTIMTSGGTQEQATALNDKLWAIANAHTLTRAIQAAPVLSSNDRDDRATEQVKGFVQAAGTG